MTLPALSLTEGSMLDRPQKMGITAAMRSMTFQAGQGIRFTAQVFRLQHAFILMASQTHGRVGLPDHPRVLCPVRGVTGIALPLHKWSMGHVIDLIAFRVAGKTGLGQIPGKQGAIGRSVSCMAGDTIPSGNRLMEKGAVDQGLFDRLMTPETQTALDIAQKRFFPGHMRGMAFSAMPLFYRSMDNLAPEVFRIIRITSYNVCYTKLLRATCR